MQLTPTRTQPTNTNTRRNLQMKRNAKKPTPTVDSSRDGERPADRRGRVWPPIPDDALPQDIVLPRLGMVSDRGEGEYTARCPAHPDNDPSLSLKVTAGYDMLVYCHAGCTLDKICSALGLTVAHLFATDYAKRRRGKTPRPVPTKSLAVPDDTDSPPDPRLARLVKQHRYHPDRTRHVRELAAALGVSADALDRLRIGWAEAVRSRWSIPERDDRSRVVGISFRHPDGERTSLPGGRRGLSIPRGQTGRGTLYVCEGMSDTAAMLDAGRRAIGRPSASPSARVQVWLKRFVDAECVGDRVTIVGDRDDPGVEGARKLAKWLAEECGREVRWALPQVGHKDVREQWRAAGHVRLRLQS